MNWGAPYTSNVAVSKREVRRDALDRSEVCL